MNNRLATISEGVKVAFIKLNNSLKYEYLRPGDAIDNAVNEIYLVQGWGERLEIVIQVINRETHISLLFNVLNYYFSPEFAEKPFFRQLAADIIEVQKCVNYLIKTNAI